MSRVLNDYRTPDGRHYDAESVAVMAEPLRRPPERPQHPIDFDGRCHCACCDLAAKNNPVNKTVGGLPS